MIDMGKLLGVSLLASAIILGFGCGGDGDGDAAIDDTGPTLGETISFNREIQPIFTAQCLSSGVTGCHQTGGLAPMSLEADVSYANTVGTSRVVPGDSDSSLLFLRISGSSNGPQMPLNGSALSQADQNKIEAWILQGANNDLTLDLTAFTPHVGQLMEFRVIQGTTATMNTGTLSAKIILDPLPSAAFLESYPAIVMPGSNRLDFFADLSLNGLYDQNPVDHEWSVDIPDTGNVSFIHNIAFTVIGATAPVEALDFTLDLTAMTPHIGQLFELRVYDDASGNTVGAYRLGAIPAADFSVTIPGIITPGTTYRVDYYADLSGNGLYDVPPTDHAWRQEATAIATGLTMNFVHNIDFTDIGL